MTGLESAPLFLLVALTLGYFWGRYQINRQSSSFYRTRRLTKKQERILIDGLKAARTYIKTN